MSTRYIIVVLLGMLLALTPVHSKAATLIPGDLVVVDTSSRTLIQIDPLSGAQELISSDDLMVNPRGIVLDNTGKILVADDSGIIRVDPLTGEQAMLSSGGSFVTPWGIAVDTAGDIFVSDMNAFEGNGGIIKVNPVTGAQSTISSNGLFADPNDITFDAQGNVLVADVNGGGGCSPWGCGQIIKVDPFTGEQTLVSSGGFFFDPTGIAVDLVGDILVADHNAFGYHGGIFKVDPSTGNQTVISNYGAFIGPNSLVVDPTGDIWVTNHGGANVIKVDPATGTQTVVSSDGFFDHGPVDILIVGDVEPIPEPATMLLLGSGLVGFAGFRKKFKK